MKYNFKKKLAVATLSLLLPMWISAQEKEIEVHCLDDVTSIIRETKDGLWLVCNNSNSMSRFTLVNEATLAVPAPQLFLTYITGTDSTCINDFEIFRDTVYFCGQTWREKVSTGIWGYFPLTGFPNVNVSYTEMGCDYLSRLDVYSIDTMTYDLHVVMLGRSSDYINLALLYDVVRTASNVFTSYSKALFPSDPTTVLRDVAVTNHHVAVASTGGTSRILFINKPTTTATTILNGTASYYEWITGLPIDMVLENCINDTLVMVFKRYNENINVHSFYNGTAQHRIRIDNTVSWRPVDVKFERSTEEIDILTNSSVSFPRSVSSKIFHIGYWMINGGGLLLYKIFQDEELNSLDWLATQNREFVASGHDANAPHYLRLYKYYFYYNPSCFKLDCEDSYKVDVLFDNDKLDLTSSGKELEMIELRSYDMENPLEVLCGQDDK